MKRLWVCILFITFVSSHYSWSQNSATKPEHKELTVEVIFGSDELTPRRLSGLQWTPDGSGFTYYNENKEKNILEFIRCRVRDGACSVWFDSSEVQVFSRSRKEKRFTLPNYIWSPTDHAILFPYKNDLYLYYPGDKKLIQLTDDEEQERDPSFSQDGKYIAYIKNNNLHVLDIETKKEYELTTMGNKDILVGRFDWVYEEEFGIRTGFFWSKTGHTLAFYILDQSKEPRFPITDFIPIYNTVEWMRYPKAGEQNAFVRIGVISWEGQANPSIHRVPIQVENDAYIPRIYWGWDGALYILWLNRNQNHLKLFRYALETGTLTPVLEEKVGRGWIDIRDDIYFFKKKPWFLWSSERDGYRHLYLYNTNGELIRQVTHGTWDVTHIVQVDEEKGIIYFLSTNPTPLERHLYSIRLDGKRLRRMTFEPGTHRINMNKQASYYIDIFSNVKTPPQYRLYSTKRGKLIRIIEKNEMPQLRVYTWTTPEFLQIPLPDGTSLHAMIHKPPHFQENKKYPVLIYTYGGPGSQVVMNRWTGARWYYWNQLLANKGIIVVSVDNRGTGGRGRDWKHILYHRLGTYESDDQIFTARYLKKLPYVDGNRIGIWGWSYGGYNTLMSLLKGGTLFRMGIAVAPVTDWRNYDSIYTERYMGLPDENKEGYEQSSAVKRAADLKSALLIVHGTSDDNVHLSNTLQFIYELEKNRIPFELMLYPRKLHGIRGKDERVHLFHTMLRFIERTLLDR